MDADAAPTSDAGPAPLLAVAGLEIGPRDDALPRLVGPLSFAVAPGEALGLVGESGSGKSLTALSLLGLLPANLQRRAGSI
ncbi:MAG: ATP-binding cassette domain-containing protein, partial [Planctomycetota bacterium]